MAGMLQTATALPALFLPGHARPVAPTAGGWRAGPIPEDEDEAALMRRMKTVIPEIDDWIDGLKEGRVKIKEYEHYLYQLRAQNKLTPVEVEGFLEEGENAALEGRMKSQGGGPSSSSHHHHHHNMPGKRTLDGA